VAQTFLSEWSRWSHRHECLCHVVEPVALQSRQRRGKLERGLEPAPSSWTPMVTPFHEVPQYMYLSDRADKTHWDE